MRRTSLHRIFKVQALTELNYNCTQFHVMELWDRDVFLLEDFIEKNRKLWNILQLINPELSH
jgi:hypothetical protein